jgi:flagellar biosynthesis/type III secretory pathway M-ring protein FliF/YscJ
MLFVLVTTTWALISLTFNNFSAGNGIAIVNGLAAVILVGLAIFLLLRALFLIRREKHAAQVEGFEPL